MLLTATSLSKSHGLRELFRGVCVSIAEGERIGMIGPNGAGKSTLLRMLAGREEPDDGLIRTPRGTVAVYVPQRDEFAPGATPLSACTADGAFHVGPPTQDGGGDTRRVKSAVAADAPLDPSRPIADVETQGVLWRDGDFIRVWWKSRASGWSRVTPAAEQ